MSINRWIDKQNVVYTHNGIALTRNGILTHATIRMNPEETMLSLKKTESKGQILYDSTYKSRLDYIGNFKDRKLKVVVISD